MEKAKQHIQSEDIRNADMNELGAIILIFMTPEMDESFFKAL